MCAHYIAQDFANRTGRQLVTHWTRNADCHAGIEDLFTWSGPSSLPANGDWQVLRYDPRRDVAPIDLDEDLKAEHVVLDITWQWATREGFRHRLGSRADAARHFLQPRPEILQQVEAGMRDWPTSVIRRTFGAEIL